SLKTSIKTITYLSDIGCLEIQGASLQIALPECRQQTDIQILTTSNSLTVHLYSFNFHQSI
ncbi:hypothetical protein OU537_23695, partial [Escherichia coli]|nr:hypothetical protein [Escherichia coli]MDF8664104.1 hypothetical protein [Escherichia coli]